MFWVEEMLAGGYKFLCNSIYSVYCVFLRALFGGYIACKKQFYYAIPIYENRSKASNFCSSSKS